MIIQIQRDGVQLIATYWQGSNVLICCLYAEDNYDTKPETFSHITLSMKMATWTFTDSGPQKLERSK
jgi:hypothetical protein